MGLHIFFLYVSISAFFLGRKSKAYKLKKINRWYFYLAMFIVISTITSVFNTYASSITGAKTFNITSGSMIPALQIGDSISLNTRYKSPVVGDVVVFRYPLIRSKNYIARVAAVGGDTISIENGRSFEMVKLSLL